MPLCVWIRKRRCTEQRPQPGWACNHHTSLRPATLPPVGCIFTLSRRRPARNSEHSKDCRSKRLLYRISPLEGSRKTTVVAQHEKVCRLGEEPAKKGQWAGAYLAGVRAQW